ncbi:MAG: hypothetical protein EPN43_12165 [Jatrophihabitans sp.]|nr:MAG: hypothetical protein EPN43_12165 [Jatrophihabitans sp.]
MPRISSAARLTAGAAALLVAAGCATQSAAPPPKTVTVTRKAPPTAGATRSGPATGTPTTGASGAATMTSLPGTCDNLLPISAVVNALHRNVPGNTAFVVGTAEADINRIGYINCRYGLTAPNSPPVIEIGVSLYGTAADASKRIQPTVDDFTAHGASPSTVTVAGTPAQLLTGGTGTGYGPTIVLASGQRTVAVTMLASATQDARTDLVALATLALQRTAA